MTSLTRSLRRRLAVESLEDRATPAAGLYTALTETLTITAVQGDALVVSAIPSSPTGYLTVTETNSAATVFSSATASHAVRNLVVRFGNTTTGTLTLDATVQLGGSLSVGGATGALTVDLAGSVGGNFTYTASTLPGVVAIDEVDLESTAVVGGNAVFTLGSGPNTAKLKGGLIHGNLTVTAGGGDDTVEVNASSDLNVDGAVAFNLGNGTNTFTGKGTHVLRAGGNFTYTGGIGNDTIDFDSLGDTLEAHGDAKFILGTPVGFDANAVSLEAIYARNISFVGGAGSDTIEASGALVATGNVTLNLGNGTNSFDSNQGGMGTNTIGGNFIYVGGMNADTVQLDNTTIGRNASIGLGAALAGANAFVGIGLKNPGPVSVYGNLTITETGNTADSGILLARLYVGGNFNFTGGSGSDNVVMDDTNVAGNTLLNMGVGNDFLNLEQTNSDSGGPLNGTSTFGGTFTFNGGAGNDGVFLTVSNTSGLAGQFGGHAAFIGGTGTDALHINNGTTFEQTGNFTDFETVTGTLP